MRAPDRPDFRFFPGAFDRPDVFEPSATRCAACGRAADWLYIGPVYALTEPALCARCIADGRCAEILDEHFTLHDMRFSEPAPDFAVEVGQRTPGFATFNPFTWPVRGGVPMAFLGHGDDPAFWSDQRVRDAMRLYWRAETGEPDLDGPTAYLLVFRTLDGADYGFARDLD